MANTAFVGHEPCGGCSSTDAFARYADGSGRCYAQGCNHREQGGSSPRSPSGGTVTKAATPMIEGEYARLNARRISEDTCKHLDYRVNAERGVQIATYYDAKGVACAQKIRTADKKFRWTGDPSRAVLYGQTKCAAKGKRVIVTEGEIDALSVDEALGRKWPVVSVPNGAGGAKAALAKQIEWLSGFGEIVLFFDTDAPGQAAAIECAELFAPGKVLIVSGFAYHDASAALQAGDVSAVIKAQYNARPYWPDDIVEGGTESLWERVNAFEIRTDYHYPWVALDSMLNGIRRAELVLWTAGSGIGKSHALRELSLHLLPTLIGEGKRLGIIALEESVEVTALRLASMHMNVSHTTWDEIPMEDRHAAVLEATAGTLIYDHFGSLESTRLLAKIRALIAGGCDVIMLDHISIVVSGSEEANQNERRTIDVLMTNLRSLVQEKNVSIHVISHLRKSGGQAHEEGGRIALDDLRGSGSLKQLSDIIIAMERDQQGDTEEERLIALLRVLKNRWTGATGPAGWIKYDPATTRYTEVHEDPFGDSCDTPTDSIGAGF